MKRYELPLGFPKLGANLVVNKNARRHGFFASTVKRNLNASANSSSIKRSASSGSDKSSSSNSTESFNYDKRNGNTFNHAPMGSKCAVKFSQFNLKNDNSKSASVVKSKSPIVPVICESSLAAMTAPGGSLNHGVYLEIGSEHLYQAMCYNPELDLDKKTR